jgi:hypothetical protein
MNPGKEKILGALRDPHWDWRTLAGLERTTGLPQAEIITVLNGLSDQIEAVSSERGLLFRLKERPDSPEPAIEKFLDFMSFGRRSRGG